jgi:putative intracellular protease/amidase
MPGQEGAPIMAMFKRLMGNAKKWDRRPGRAVLGVQTLDRRDLPSASPLPVLLVIADQRDFYYREYADTRTSILGQGVGVVVAATTTQPSTPHWNSGQATGTAGTITPQIALAQVDASNYSAIAFVGGWGSSMYQYAYNDPNGDGVIDNYYSDALYNGDSNLGDGQIAQQKVVVNRLINQFIAAEKPVAAICHGVTVLAWARVDGVSPLSGRQVAVPHLEGSPNQFYAGAWRTGGYFTGQRDQVQANGGITTTSSGAYGNPNTTADDVIVDGRIITGENPASSPLFGLRIAQRVLADMPAPPVFAGPDLVVSGTSRPDTIVVGSTSIGNQVSVSINGVSFGLFSLTSAGRVLIEAGAGNDRVVADTLNRATRISGGAGNDTITGGLLTDLIRGNDGSDRLSGAAGNDIIVGGAGDDTIDGSDGRDLLIGGVGTDRVRGGAGEDILIGGTTSYDNDDTALIALHGIWLSPAPLADRIAVLTSPKGLAFRPGDTVQVGDEEDALNGGFGEKNMVLMGKKILQN